MQTVTIRTFDNYIQANLLLMRLQDSGLACWLNDEFTVTIDPLLTNSIGGIKLVVAEKDVELAMRMITEAEEEYHNNAACPRCKNTGLLYISKPSAKNFITAMLSWLFSSYALSGEMVYECQHCGWEDKKLPEPEFDSTHTEWQKTDNDDQQRQL